MDGRRSLTRDQSSHILSKIWALHGRMVSASKKSKNNSSLSQFIANDHQWQMDVAEVLP